MEMDKPDSPRGFRASGLIAVAALLAVAAGGYLYYENSERQDVSSEVPRQTASQAPATTGTAPSGNPPNAPSSSSSQRVVASAKPPTEPAPNQSSQTPAVPANNAPAVPPQQAQTQAQANPPAAPTGSSSATAPAAAAAQSERTKPASLPTNEIAYVQRSRANIRSEPSARAKRIGQAARGTKMNVLGRSGKWVQVENGETKGWISGRLLGPALP
jgi:cytoskeletal protein RodZ